MLATPGSGAMSESGGTEPPEGPEREEQGVMGSLPRTRPGIRSPRRGRGGPRRKPSVQTGAGRRPEPSGGLPGDLEGVARAGISAASEAAATGARLAGRAARALRDALERR